MMHGTLNTDRLCTVLEQIFSQRDPKVEVHVKVVSEELGAERKADNCFSEPKCFG